MSFSLIRLTFMIFNHALLTFTASFQKCDDVQKRYSSIIITVLTLCDYRVNKVKIFPLLAWIFLDGLGSVRFFYIKKVIQLS